MKIAIIGSGIAGNTLAHHLHKHHDITVFKLAAILAATPTRMTSNTKGASIRSIPVSSSSTIELIPTSSPC